MNLHQAFQIFLSCFAVERQAIAAQKIAEIAKSENLDVFLEAEEDCKPGEVYYCTVHGFRSMDRARSELNQFIVTKKGNGFSIAKNLPYIYLPISKCEPPQLIVESPSESATAAGYAQAIRLPCVIIADRIDEYPQGTTIVCIVEDNEEAATFGYANAIPLPCRKSKIYIQKIDMLDTEYAALLEDVSRF